MDDRATAEQALIDLGEHLHNAAGRAVESFVAAWVAVMDAAREQYPRLAQIGDDEMDNMAQQYSHRNGETDPPAQVGHYWFCGKAFQSRARHMVWVVMMTKDKLGIVATERIFSLDHYKGQWWGPLEPPWKEDKWPTS